MKSFAPARPCFVPLALATLALMSPLFSPVPVCAKTAASKQYPSIEKVDTAGGAQALPGSKAILNIARAAYASDSPHLYDAGSVCRKAEANLVLYGKGDNDVGFDKAAIKTGGANDSDTYRFFYSIKDYHGRRLLLKKYQQSWQGDMHDLLSVDAKADVNKLIGTLASLDISDGKNLPSDCKLVTSGDWNCPWLVGGKDASGIDAIELGHPVVVLSDWAVYSVTANGAIKKVAVVKFRPPAEKVATLIPDGSLKKLYFLLDKIIGVPAEDEGTYGATSRVRVTAAHAWGNLVYRPWAMEVPHNTRAQVDAGLKKWSSGAAAYKSQYQELLKLYPLAEAQLARHYRESLGKSEKDARNLAHSALDKTLRLHFVFPAG
ncbi:hypothetical protein GC174_02160 [bacterium]|nr:hypothetical protein [bacterium]